MAEEATVSGFMLLMSNFKPNHLLFQLKPFHFFFLIQMFDVNLEFCIALLQLDWIIADWTIE